MSEPEKPPATPASRKFRLHLPTAIALIAVFLLGVALTRTTNEAHASQVIATLSGTVSTGTDYSGYFTHTITYNNLLGQPFTVVYSMDDTAGVTNGVWPACNNGRLYSGLSNPAPLATITIGGKSWTVGALAPMSFYSGTGMLSANFTSPKTQLTFDTRDDDYWNGGSVDEIWGTLNLATTYCRDWETAWTYTLVAGDVPDYNFDGDVLTAGGSPLINVNVDLTVVSLNVTSTSTAATLTTTNANNFGHPCCYSYQQAAAGVVIIPNAAQGDPINAAFGNMTMSETDFVGGPATHLSFTRAYNSLDMTAGPFGIGWHSTYHRALALTTSTSITVTRADGRQDIFTYSGSAWTPQANVTSALAATGSGYALTLPNDTVENYNTGGLLTSIVERNGLTTSLTYTSSNLTTVTGPFSHTLTFTYDGSNRVSTMTLPDGTNKFTYTYDNNNNLISVKNPDATTHSYGHGVWPFRNLITDIFDEDGNPYAHWTYDSQGRALTSEHAAGADLITVTYTSGSSSTVTDANNNAHTYALTSNYGLVQPSSVTGVPDLGAGGASFTYDANGFVASVTDYDGNVTQYTHNAAGEETSRTEGYGSGLARTTTTLWSGTFHVPTEIDAPLGRTTTFGYDASGNLTSIGMTDGTYSRTMSYTYNASMERTSATDALGNTTTWTYDGSGDVATVVNALGQVTTYNGYDGNGRVISMTNPLGTTTTFAYDSRGRMGSVTVGGLKTTTSYDNASSKPVKVTYADGTYLTYSYDDLHRLIKVKNVAGEYASYTYDAMSNLTEMQLFNATNTQQYIHTYTYDSQNRTLTTNGATLGETTTYGYDDQGNVLTVEDPNGHFMQYTYDALNRQATAEDPYSGITTTTYDALDDVVSVTDPLSLTTTYTWDGYGDQLSVISPDTGTSTASYNAAGLVLTTTDARGKSASYTYDALNRTATISYTGGTTVGYLYDTTTFGIGQIGQMVDPAGTTTWSYDKYGQVLKKVQTQGALAFTTSYQYDAYERPLWMLYPSNHWIEYLYDTTGRVNGVAYSIANYYITYSAMGPASSWPLNNGSTYTRTFDQDRRITGTALSSATTASNNTQTVTYDNASNITALSETSTLFTGRTYGYDSYNRLSSFFSGTATTTWTYDANSNRTTTVLSSTTTYSYTAGTNQLSALTGSTTASFGYDASGNMTSDGTNTYHYDTRGRMDSTTALSVTTTYAVNGFNQRLKKTSTGGTSYFVYDEYGHMVGEYGSTGTVIEETVYMPDTQKPVLSHGFGFAGFGANYTPVSVYNGTYFSSVAADYQNNPHIIENASKQYVWVQNSYPFGDNGPNQNPTGLGTYAYNQRAAYPLYADAETGNLYNGNRYRGLKAPFLQYDPLWGDDPGRSPYVITAQNPMSFTDPYGLDWKSESLKWSRVFCLMHQLCSDPTFNPDQPRMSLPTDYPVVRQSLPVDQGVPDAPDAPEKICPRPDTWQDPTSVPMKVPTGRPDSGTPSNPDVNIPWWRIMRWLPRIGSRDFGPWGFMPDPCAEAPWLCPQEDIILKHH